LGGGGIYEKWGEKREENANEKEGKTKGKGKLKLKGERLSQKGCLMYKGGYYLLRGGGGVEFLGRFIL
jgi:hypothetical protein